MRGQSLIGIIIVLAVVGLITGGLFFYLQKQILEISEIPKKPAGEEIAPPSEEETKEEIPPEEKTEEEPAEEPAVQKCSGGTPYGQCSTNKPKYCENGNLIDKCSTCSCPSGQECQTDGSCVVPAECTSGPCCNISTKTFRSTSYICQENVATEYGCPWGSNPGDDVGVRYQHRYCSGSSANCDGALQWGDWNVYNDCASNEACINNSCTLLTCPDGTPYGQCSTNKPRYCQNGALLNRCSVCGCPLNQYCDESSNACLVAERLDMLVFISPQYRNNTQIKQAINEYIDAVKDDVGWATKIITITSDINDFRKIDEIIEDYYSKSGGRLKACIMVGEDMDTALTSDLPSAEESPSTAPWSTTGGENPAGFYIPGKEDTYTIDLYAGGDLVVSHEQMINIAISLIYPTHSLSYQMKSSQIISVFNKFSKNRSRLYPEDIRAFVSSQYITESPRVYEIYQTLKNYGNLYYKEEPTQLEINESLTKSYKMYSITGHSRPGFTVLGVNRFFYADYLNELNTPLFTAGGCHTAGWYADPNQNTDNNTLDFSIDKSWYGSKIFVNPNLRAMILGFPEQPGGSGNYNFIMNAVPGLNAGKTLAESIINHYYFGNDLILYGDPTFHYNF